MKFYLERYIHANNFLFQLCYLKVEFKLYYALIIWVCYLFDFVYYALKQLPREKIQLATKFGISRGQGSGFTGMTIKGSPEYVRSCCEASLKRLGVEYIDLYYQQSGYFCAYWGYSSGFLPMSNLYFISAFVCDYTLYYTC
jgi:hypothetical protein